MVYNANLPYNSYINENILNRITELTKKDLDIDELWQIYGESLGSYATGKSLIESAKRNFKRRSNEIKNILCNSQRIKKFIHDPITCTKVDLALVFTGKLIEENFGGVDVATVGVLVAQLGIQSLCEDKWSE